MPNIGDGLQIVVEIDKGQAARTQTVLHQNLLPMLTIQLQKKNAEKLFCSLDNVCRLRVEDWYLISLWRIDKAFVQKKYYFCHIIVLVSFLIQFQDRDFINHLQTT